MPIHLITAINNKNAIGLNGELLYRLSKDLKHFRQVTSGHTVLMGRTTFNEIKKPLPNRYNIVASRHKLELPEGVELCNDLHYILNKYKNSDEVLFVIGGSEIYSQSLPYVTKAYITHINDDKKGDTIFPFEYIRRYFKEINTKYEIDNGFILTFREYARRDEVDGIN